MRFDVMLFATAVLLLIPQASSAQNRERALGARQERAALCAREGGHCRFQGIANVRYGARGRYVTRPVVDGVPCTSDVFGDPYPGVRKSCFVFLLLGVGY